MDTNGTYKSTNEEFELSVKGAYANGEVPTPVLSVATITPVHGTTVEIPVVEEPSEKTRTLDVIYGVDDTPPWYVCLVLGLQHVLTMFGGTIAYPLQMSEYLCVPPEEEMEKGHLISTTFLVSGIATLLQATIGVRLPIIQGCTFALFVPSLALLTQPEWNCDSGKDWKERMRELQGAIIMASLLEVFIGATGLIGLVLRFITPLTITPTIALIGLSLFEVVAEKAGSHWGIAALTFVLVGVFSQYLAGVKIPIPAWKNGKFRLKKFPIFKTFPVILAILIVWGVCAILTVTDAVSVNSSLRTDTKLDALHNSSWFRPPYPGQWGMPTVSAGAVLGMIAGILASIVESVGDYHACARLAGAPEIPSHAVNRGIFAEGVSCVIAGLFGSGGGLTSFSENIGAIGVTRVASRRVVQYAGAIIIVFGFIGKVGGLFVTVPSPIVGGIFCVMFSIVASVGLSNLQKVDLNSSRNLFILGFSLFMGLCIPHYLKHNKDAIDTGLKELDQIINILLSTSMFVGGFLGCLLDNTMPGKSKLEVAERSSDEADAAADDPEVRKCYNMPLSDKFTFGDKYFKYFPISSSYRPGNIRLFKRR